jgi:hypothetical protein
MPDRFKNQLEVKEEEEPPSGHIRKGRTDHLNQHKMMIMPCIKENEENIVFLFQDHD